MSTKMIIPLFLTALFSSCSVQSNSSVVKQEAQTNVCNGKPVLFVTSSSPILTLDDGSEYPSGVFLREITDPALALIKAGCEIVVATPDGISPTIDSNSLELLWTYYPYPELKPQAPEIRDQAIDIAEKLYGKLSFSKEDPRWDRLTDEVETYIEKIQIRSANITEKKVRSLAVIADELEARQEEGLESQFAGVFVPGGHVPLEDLVDSTELGRVLKYFHTNGLPTGLVCHGPVALLSPMSIGENIYNGYTVSAIEGQGEALLELAGPLIGYRVKDYVDDLLVKNGINVQQNPWPGYPMVVRDRELVTGQNPASGPFLAEAFIAMLSGSEIPYMIPDSIRRDQTRQSHAARRMADLALNLSELEVPVADTVSSFLGFDFSLNASSGNIFVEPTSLLLFDKSINLVAAKSKPYSSELNRIKLPFLSFTGNWNLQDLLRPKYNYIYKFPHGFYGDLSEEVSTKLAPNCENLNQVGDPLEWLKTFQTQSELTRIFDCMAPEENIDLPIGQSKGYGSLFSNWPLWNELQSQVGQELWGGKHLFKQDGETYLLNQMLDTGTDRYKAHVYETTSIRDGEPTIVLDYRNDDSLTVFGPARSPAQGLIDKIAIGIRDEIRELNWNGVPTGIYIGRAYLSKSVMKQSAAGMELVPPSKERFNAHDEWFFAANFFLDFRVQ